MAIRCTKASGALALFDAGCWAKAPANGNHPAAIPNSEAASLDKCGLIALFLSARVGGDACESPRSKTAKPAAEVSPQRSGKLKVRPART